MGTQSGMGCQHNRIRLYTSQSDEVIDRLLAEGVSYVKMEYITKKYAEVASVFLRVYTWYAQRAERIVERPPEAESAVWTFCRREYLELFPGSQVLELSVPIERAVFFRMRDWNRVLNLQYLGEKQEDESNFSEMLSRYGILSEADAYLKPFYPHLKREIKESWKALFRYDREVKESGKLPYPDMQAGLWCLKRDWIV